MHFGMRDIGVHITHGWSRDEVPRENRLNYPPTLCLAFYFSEVLRQSHSISEGSKSKDVALRSVNGNLG